MTLGFLGPAHSFCERAATLVADGRALVPLADIAALVAALADSAVACIVVPIENNEVGAVPATLAALLALATPLAVSGDLRLPIRFALYRRAGDTGPLTMVVAHAMSLAQCAPWIAARGVCQRAVGSNGTAFAQVRDCDAAGEGALAPIGIEEDGMIAVERDVQGARAFETRFLLLERECSSPDDLIDRALVMVAGRLDRDEVAGSVRRLTVRSDHADAGVGTQSIYEITLEPPILPARLPGRPLLLWRARA